MRFRHCFAFCCGLLTGFVAVVMFQEIKLAKHPVLVSINEGKQERNTETVEDREPNVVAELKDGYIRAVTRAIPTTATVKMPQMVSKSERFVPYERFKKLDACQATRKHFFYLGVHRTASSTLRILFQYFAIKQNLLLCMDSITKWRSAWPFDFTSDLVMIPHDMKCDVLAEPMIYNQNELKRIAHDDTVYITSVAHPLDHFISMFISNQILPFTRQLSGKGNSMSLVDGMSYFLDNPALVTRFFASLPDKRKGNQFQTLLQRANLQLFDIGFNKEEDATIHDIKKRLSDFHVVLLPEYFDESLILLKNKMCWSNKDIYYTTVKKIRDATRRAKHRTLSPELNKRILSYNNGDMMLYKAANRTFWKEIENISNFSRQLLEFRKELETFQVKCSTAQKQHKILNNCFPQNENVFWKNLQNQVRIKLHSLALERLKDKAKGKN